MTSRYVRKLVRIVQKRHINFLSLLASHAQRSFLHP